MLAPREKREAGIELKAPDHRVGQGGGGVFEFENFASGTAMHM
jgi:hypothetical protein